MVTIYRVGDVEFVDKEQALKYEALISCKETVSYMNSEKKTVFPLSCLQEIFNVGTVSSMSLLMRDKATERVYIDDDLYETYFLDDSGHLDCTDLHCGLLYWNKKFQSYYRTVYSKDWAVEVLGILKVDYV